MLMASFRCKRAKLPPQSQNTSASYPPTFDVRTSIGGTGVIGILENGTDGEQTKTILLRADMDALPVAERTSLDFASKKTMKDTDGEVKPVMHACGHDLHVTLEF